MGLYQGPLYRWICWNLWLSRNQRVFNSRRFSEKETILKATRDAIDWQAAQAALALKSTKPSGSRISSFVEDVDLSSVVTIHTDAAWKKETKTTGIGWNLKYPNAEETYSQLPAIWWCPLSWRKA